MPSIPATDQSPQQANGVRRVARQETCARAACSSYARPGQAVAGKTTAFLLCVVECAAAAPGRLCAATPLLLCRTAPSTRRRPVLHGRPTAMVHLLRQASTPRNAAGAVALDKKVAADQRAPLQSASAGVVGQTPMDRFLIVLRPAPWHSCDETPQTHNAIYVTTCMSWGRDAVSSHQRCCYSSWPQPARPPCQSRSTRGR